MNLFSCNFLVALSCFRTMDILQLIIHDIAITPSKNRKRKKIKLEFKYFDIIKSANEGGHFSPFVFIYPRKLRFSKLKFEGNFLGLTET